MPAQWESYSFHLRFRGNLLNVKGDRASVEIINQSGKQLDVRVYGKEFSLEPGNHKVVERSIK
jgi:maltose phosphorylase